MFSDCDSVVHEAGMLPSGTEARSYIYCSSQARAVLFHALREDLTVFQLFYLKKEENLAFEKKED